MVKTKTINFLIAVLAIGFGFFTLPNVGLAQAAKTNENSNQTECKLEAEDDADDKADQAKLLKQAQITMEQARAAALLRVDGKVLKEEIEKERGRLQYTFDICKEGKLYDVEVDAKTGQVLQAALDDDDDQEEEDDNAVKQSKIKEKSAQKNRNAKKLF